jgi:hypothetical protein
MKNVVLATTLVCALIGVSHAEAKTKNHNHPVQMVETAPQPQPGDGGYHQASGFEMVKAQCELVANGLQPSPGFVMGSQEYVAGAAIGSAIGGLMVHAQNYDHCMTLKGYAKN